MTHSSQQLLGCCFSCGLGVRLGSHLLPSYPHGILMQYLQLQLGFSTPDQAHVLVVASACSLAVKLTVQSNFCTVQWTCPLSSISCDCPTSQWHVILHACIHVYQIDSHASHAFAWVTSAQSALHTASHRCSASVSFETYPSTIGCCWACGGSAARTSGA